MSKTNWLLGAFISSVVFLFGCSSPTECNCSDNPSSSGVENPGSSSSVYSSSSLKTSSSSTNTVQDHDLIRKYITLTSDNGYADIDGEPATYTKDEAANNLAKIDLVAYCSISMGCQDNSIYDPWEIGLFWNRGEYIGGNAVFFEIQNEQTAIFESATKYSEIYETLVSLATTFNNMSPSDYLSEISIAPGKGLFVYTTGKEGRIVIIKAAGNQSVDLEIIIP